MGAASRGKEQALGNGLSSNMTAPEAAGVTNRHLGDCCGGANFSLVVKSYKGANDYGACSSSLRECG